MSRLPGRALAKAAPVLIGAGAVAVLNHRRSAHHAEAAIGREAEAPGTLAAAPPEATDSAPAPPAASAERSGDNTRVPAARVEPIHVPTARSDDLSPAPSEVEVPQDRRRSARAVLVGAMSVLLLGAAVLGVWLMLHQGGRAVSATDTAQRGSTPTPRGTTLPPNQTLAVVGPDAVLVTERLDSAGGLTRVTLSVPGGAGRRHVDGVSVTGADGLASGPTAIAGLGASYHFTTPQQHVVVRYRLDGIVQRSTTDRSRAYVPALTLLTSHDGPRLPETLRISAPTVLQLACQRTGAPDAHPCGRTSDGHWSVVLPRGTGATVVSAQVELR